jgi:hypothetical protein
MTSAVISINGLLNLVPKLPPSDSVLLRGDHGIGKSALIRQIAAEVARLTGHPLPVVDVRISQMSDGDMIGLPKFKEIPGIGEATTFAPPAWYMECVREPRALFLDEFNRGTMEIMQACFQIVLDRCMNGVPLHPETRVYAAINNGALYSVNTMDPALLDRLAVFDLVPDADDWLKWAREIVVNAKGQPEPRIHPNITGFIAMQPMFLDPPRNGAGGASYDPSEVHPSRRSWDRVDQTLKFMGIQDDHNNPLYYQTLVSRLGNMTAATMKRYLDTMAQTRLTGAMVLDDYLTVDKADIGKKKKTKKTDPVLTPAEVLAQPIGFVQDKIRKLIVENKLDTLNQVVDDVIAEIEKRDLSTKLPMHIKYSLCALFNDLPHELRYTLYTSWGKSANPKRQELITETHEYVINFVLNIFGYDVNKKDDKGNMITEQVEEPAFLKAKREAEAAAAAAQ